MYESLKFPMLADIVNVLEFSYIKLDSLNVY